MHTINLQFLDEYVVLLSGTVHDTINRGGRVLIPVFALGRAQELLLILGNYVLVFTNRLNIASVISVTFSCGRSKLCEAFEPFLGRMINHDSPLIPYDS